MNYNQRGLQTTNPQQWYTKNRVNLPGVTEVIWEPLYHRQAIAAGGGTTSLTFFQAQAGVGSVTEADTNMDLQGQLPSGKSFLVTGIQIAFYTDQNAEGATAAASGIVTDAVNFYKNGVVKLKIGSKNYLTQAPFGKFPPVERMAVVSDNTGGEVAANVTELKYAMAAGREFSITDLLLENGQNFGVELSGIASLTFASKIMVTLNGYLGRNAQ